MTVAADELKLEVSRSLPYPPERVFDAWLDPKMLAKFMIPGPGMTVPEATSDARVGGRFRIVMRGQEMGDMPHEGTYKAIDRPKRIVFTWESPFSSREDSTVTLDFAPEGKGTKLTLTHIRFESEESRANHEGGWTRILDALADAF